MKNMEGEFSRRPAARVLLDSRGQDAQAVKVLDGGT
jgi:hypothetical protein